MTRRASFKPFQNTHHLEEHYQDIRSLQAETIFRLFDSWFIEARESRLC